MAKTAKNLKEVSPRQDFVKMEQEHLDRWYKDGLVDKYLHKNDGAKENFSFIDGPITANNPMGVHHAWGRTYKDTVQRYKNLQGFEQRFQNGFDCQGLWVEVEVEKAMGFNSKKDIAEFGLGKFTDTCKARVGKFSGIQTDQSKRLGMFMDWDNSYYTMSESNNLEIWNFLKKVKEKDLLYKKKSATTWCPRCETGLSEHEKADGYKMITDKSVFFLVKFSDADNEYALVWTTTPWTLSSNVLVAINPKLEYVSVEHEGKTVYVGKSAAKKLGFNEADMTDADPKDLVGREYESIYNDIPAQKGVKHTFVEWDLVAEDSGSAMVHIAPGCGQEDYELGLELGSDMIAPLDPTGRFIEGFGDLTGKYAHDVADQVFDYLKSRGLLFKVEEFEHSYPHCWRCKTKCLFRLEENWFIAISKIRDQLKENAATVKFEPEYAGKRMQDWLDNMGDWMISRKRYYGLSLPFYECKKCGKVHVIGSKEELRERAVKPELVDKLPSMHRPWIDDIKIKCDCGEELTRITDVGDCWLDAGVVPFSTLKYQTDKDYWNKWFPADFVTEMIEQVRLWFYSMLVFGTILENKVPYKYILATSELRDEKNERMSKTKPNYIEFNKAADKVGSDMIRWNFLASPATKVMRFGWPTLEDVRRRFYLPLWNSYSYFTMYARMHNWDPAKYDVTKLTNVFDKWMVARVAQLSKVYETEMDKYNAPGAAREIETFVQDVSTWYIRGNRNRFRDGDNDVLGTLHYALSKLVVILAPMIPFVTEEMYQNLVVNLELDGAKESVHLENFEKLELTDDQEKLLRDMENTRLVSSLGLKVRDENRLKIRQPLVKAYVPLKSEEMQEIVKNELKVKEVEYSKDKVEKDGFATTEGSNLYVSLQTQLTPELKAEGYVNEFTRQVQVLRKKTGLKMGEDVAVLYSTDADELVKALDANKDSIMATVSAKSLERADKVTPALEKPVNIGEFKVEIELKK